METISLARDIRPRSKFNTYVHRYELTLPYFGKSLPLSKIIQDKLIHAFYIKANLHLIGKNPPNPINILSTYMCYQKISCDIALTALSTRLSGTNA